MAEILKGAPVAKALTEANRERAEKLKEAGIEPALAIIRLGENPSDLSYERGAIKRAEKTGIRVVQHVLPETASQEELLGEIEKINRDDSIHGVLMFRPLPGHIDEKAVCEALDPAKDMDGITSGSMAGVFMENGMGYPPCTASAVMEIFDYYGIELKGKKVTVFGRSLVIGKPVAMMTDVGINVDEEGSLCGDVDFDKAEPLAKAITPVPAGVGSVTTAVLMKHVIQAAERKARI